MREGKESTLAWMAFNELYGYIIRINPGNIHEEIIFKQAIDNVEELAKYRRLRLVRNGSSIIPDLLWTIIFCISILFLYSNFLLRMQDRRVQIILTFVSASILGMIFSLLFLLNHPYSSGLQVSPYPFEKLIDDVFPTAEITQNTP